VISRGQHVICCVVRRIGCVLYCMQSGSTQYCMQSGSTQYCMQSSSTVMASRGVCSWLLCKDGGRSVSTLSQAIASFVGMGGVGWRGGVQLKGH
jgi:hypothetical protein